MMAAWPDPSPGAPDLVKSPEIPEQSIALS